MTTLQLLLISLKTNKVIIKNASTKKGYPMDVAGPQPEIGLENVCFSHLRYFASQGLGLLNSTGGITRERLSLQLR